MRWLRDALIRRKVRALLADKDIDPATTKAMADSLLKIIEEDVDAGKAPSPLLKEMDNYLNGHEVPAWWQTAPWKKIREGLIIPAPHEHAAPPKTKLAWSDKQPSKIAGKSPSQVVFDEFVSPKEEVLKVSLGEPHYNIDWDFPKETPVVPTEGYRKWLAAVTNPERPAVPITFIYHSRADLQVSVQEKSTGDYYDFAYKVFKPAKDNNHARAGFTILGDVAGMSYFYGASIGRSGKLHGQYVVTVRDMDKNGIIVGTLFYAIENSAIAADPKAYAGGLANYEAEKGLSDPVVVMNTAGRAGRNVELE